MEAKFNIAAEGIKLANIENLANDEKLFLYSRFKQATVGKNDTPKPGMLDLKGKAKWNAWNDLGDMSKEEAMRQYIEAAKNYVPKEVKDQL